MPWMLSDSIWMRKQDESWGWFVPLLNSVGVAWMK